MILAMISRCGALLRTCRSMLQIRAELALENLALRQQLAVFKEKRPRPVIRRLDRIFWTWLRRIWPNWRNALIMVEPETVVRWHRAGFRLYWRMISHQPPAGRPSMEKEIRELIRRLAVENPGWRAPRIHGELAWLGYAVSRRTVSRWLPRRPADPDQVRKWKAFLRNHRDAIGAMDFFTVPTVTFQVLYVFFIIGHARRKIAHHAVTFHPSAEWLLQQLREAFPFDQVPRYLIFDRDSIFCERVRQAIRSFGIRPVQTMYRSPWQNGVAGRWVGSCKRELPGHAVIFGPDHLRRLLKEYVNYYNEDRTHCTLAGDAPVSRPVEPEPFPGATLEALPRCGGLHHRYRWRQAS